MEIPTTLYFAIALLSIGIAGISIKIWGGKNGKFAGTCASQNPMLNPNQESCPLCGKKPKDSDCKNQPGISK